ncbi:MAG: glucosidase family protein, partial [Thermoguttaceae bacterium]
GEALATIARSSADWGIDEDADGRGVGQRRFEADISAAGGSAATALRAGQVHRVAISTSVTEPARLPDAVAWLEKEAHRIIRASKRTMKDGTAAFPPQVGSGYEAFWLRDYEYTLEGSIDSYSDKELADACRLFIRSLRADGAGVDCVKFDGTPIYKPGYGSMGKNPVADGSQFTVGVAWHTYRKTRDRRLLEEMIDWLVRAMQAVPRNPETHLVHIKPGSDWDRCAYGFTDSIRKQGDELFCSLLYVQASRQLAELLGELGRKEEAEFWKTEGENVARSARKVFWDPAVGLFRAATVRCRQHDIWGSAFAVYLGVADRAQSLAVAGYFKDHYAELVQHGQIRHLPGGVYWEEGCPQDTYQNGAFWGTPTGWFVLALDLVDAELADQTIIDLVADYQKNGACEWMIGSHYRLRDYLASAALPLDGIRKMIERRKSLRESATDRRTAVGELDEMRVAE